MKSNSGLDNHIRSKLNDYTPEVPPHIWENIAAQKRKRRPVGFWWWLMGRNGLFTLAGIILLGGGIWINRASFLPKNELVKTGQLIPVTKNQSLNNPVNNTAPVLIEPQVIPQNQEPTTEHSEHLANNTANSSLNTNISARQQLAASRNNDTKAVNKQPAKVFKEKGKVTVAITPSETDEEDPEEISTDETADNLLQRRLLHVELLSAKTNNLTVTNITIPCLSVPCPGSEKNSAKGKRYLEVYGGPDYAFRSMSDTGNSAYLEKRKESTKFTSAFSVGLRYTKVFQNGMSFRTGINYSQINEKFKYSQGNIIQVVYITNSNGDTTGSFSTSGTRYKTTHNKYRTVDVPLLIGYEMGNERLRVNVNAGAMINVYSWQRGDLLDTAFQPVNISTGKPSSPYQFRTNAGIGFLASASIYYKLNSRLHFLAEPYFRYNFSPASKSELTFRQKYNTAGLRLGLRYDF